MLHLPAARKAARERAVINDSAVRMAREGHFRPSAVPLIF
jgi:hypothetical protein